MEERNNEWAEEPREIVDWYVPKTVERESVGYYVQSVPLPEKARPEEPKKKHSRKGLWIFLISLGVLALAVTAGVIYRNLQRGSTPAKENENDSDTASSIVSIYADQTTSIPRYQGDPTVRLAVEEMAEEVLTPQEIYARINPAVVLVISQTGDKAMLGTGMIMTADGYIITNAHVINGGELCMIEMWNGIALEAELVGYDAQEDLAVLHAVDAEDLPAAVFASSDEALVGDTVYAIGNPMGMELRGTLTDGIISAINRSISVDGQEMTMLQTTAPLNNGNSGGPLINDRGQVIGINTMKMSQTVTAQKAGIEGLGFAIPISDAAPIVDHLIADGKYEGAPSIGIMVYTAETTNSDTAVVIAQVEEDRAGDRAGLQTGDVILSVDGQDIFRTEELLAIRRQKQIGDTITLTVYRGGEIFDVVVTMLTDRY